jgi:hypothetical protein
LLHATQSDGAVVAEIDRDIVLTDRALKGGRA